MDSVNPFNHLDSGSFPDSRGFAASFSLSPQQRPSLLPANLQWLPIAQPDHGVSSNTGCSKCSKAAECSEAHYHQHPQFFPESIQALWQLCLSGFPRGKHQALDISHISIQGKALEGSWHSCPGSIMSSTPPFPFPLSIFSKAPLTLDKLYPLLTELVWCLPSPPSKYH